MDMNRNCEKPVKLLELRPYSKTSIDHIPKEVLSLILKPFQENEESVFVGLVCKRWHSLIKQRSILTNKVVSHYLAYTKKPLPTLMLIQQIVNDDNKFLVEPLFELGPRRVIKWAFAKLNGKDRTVIRNAAKGLAKQGYLKYLKELHGQKLLFPFYQLYVPAISGGHVDVLDWLNENGYFPTLEECKSNRELSHSLHTSYIVAAKNGHKKVIKWLYKEREANCELPFIGAALGGRLKLLKSLFKHKAPSYATLEDMSEAAARGGHLIVLKWLETKGLKLGQQAASGAVQGGHSKILEYLEQIGIECEDICTSAIKGGQLKLLQHLIKTGHSRIEQEAILSGNVELLDWLVKNGYGDKIDRKIADWAASHKRYYVLKWAMANGFKCGEKSVTVTAKAGNLQIVKLLKEKGVAITEQASAAAAENGHLHIIKWLFENGIKLSTIARDNAERNGDLEMLDYINERL